MQELKANLLKAQTTISDFIENSKLHFKEPLTHYQKHQLHKLKQNIEYYKNNQQKNQNEFQKLTLEFPITDDFIGASKGMVVLNYAYDFNVTKGVHEGKLSYINNKGQKEEFQAYEKLTIIDIEQLAKTAFAKKDYEIAITMTRSILEILSKKSVKEQKEGKKRIKQLTENLIKLNNGYLEKHQTFIGKTYRTSAYMVDKKLKPKRKQPKFIENNQIYKTNYDAAIAKEWVFMKTCQYGKWLNSHLNVNHFCR